MSNEVLSLPTKQAGIYEGEVATRWRKRINGIMLFSIALVVTVTFAFPLYFMVVNSFKLDREVLSNSMQLLPTNFQ